MTVGRPRPSAKRHSLSRQISRLAVGTEALADNIPVEAREGFIPNCCFQLKKDSLFDLSTRLARAFPVRSFGLGQ